MIDKPPSKKELRDSLAQDVERFLSRGESIKTVPKGISSRDEASGPLKPSPWQMGQRTQQRTYIPDVIQNLEARKTPETKTRPITKKRARKRLIYDDFGEPLRWVWVDE